MTYTSIKNAELVILTTIQITKNKRVCATCIYPHQRCVVYLTIICINIF